MSESEIEDVDDAAEERNEDGDKKEDVTVDAKVSNEDVEVEPAKESAVVLVIDDVDDVDDVDDEDEEEIEGEAVAFENNVVELENVPEIETDTETGVEFGTELEINVVELELGVKVEKLVEGVEVEVTSVLDDNDRTTWPDDVA